MSDDHPGAAPNEDEDGAVDPTAVTGAYHSDGESTVEVPSGGAAAPGRTGPRARSASTGRGERADRLPPSIPEVEIERVLGRGGMGVVYLGRQPYIDRAVAVKVLDIGGESVDSGFVERFRREARILAKLVHPNIVSCYQAGATPEGDCYLVMELIDGPDLTGWVSEHGPLAPRHALELTMDLLRALEHAHSFGIIHRDVKPDNLLLRRLPDANREGHFACIGKLADLGLAKPQALGAGDVQVTATGMVVGTPSTMAPEQLNAPESVDFRADLYGAGCVLFFALTGGAAFPGLNFTDIVMAKVSGKVPDPRTLVPGLDAGLADWVMKLLAVNPEHRPQSYEEAITRCGALLSRIGGEQGAAPGRPAAAPGRVGTGVDREGAEQPTVLMSPSPRGARPASAGRGRGVPGAVLAGIGVVVAAVLVIVVTRPWEGGPGPEDATPDASRPVPERPGVAPDGAGAESQTTGVSPSPPAPVVFGAPQPILDADMSGWSVEPARSWGPDQETVAIDARGLLRGVARRPAPPAPWRLTGTLHAYFAGKVRLREAGVVALCSDGSAVGLVCQVLTDEATLVSVQRLAQLPPEDRGDVTVPLEVSAVEPLPLVLTLEAGKLTVEVAGRRVGEMSVSAEVTEIALYCDGSERDSVRLSALELATAEDE